MKQVARLQGALACIVPILISSCVYPSNAEIEANQNLLNLFAKTGLRVCVQSCDLRIKVGSQTVTGLAAEREGPEGLAFVTQRLYDELSLYPRELFQKTKSDTLVLCRALAINGGLRAVIPDLRTGTLYIDCDEITLLDSEYFSRYLHHEVFHLIDCRSNSDLTRNAAWMAANPAEFKYQAMKSVEGEGALDLEVPGFLSRYSRTAVNEDMAELFSFMIVYPDLVIKRSKVDSVLDKKVKLIKSQIAQVCPAMSAEYWVKHERCQSVRWMR